MSELVKKAEEYAASSGWPPGKMKVAYLSGAREALKMAAAISDAHGEFCRKEAMKGGAKSLFERASGALYVRDLIHALLPEPPK